MPLLALAIGAPICLPAFAPHSEGGEKAPDGMGGTGSCSSTLASAPMVCRLSGPLCDQALEVAARQGHAHPGGAGPPGPPVAPVSHLVFEWQALNHSRYAAELIDAIQAARQASTNCIYDATWWAFYVWCGKSDLDSSRVAVPDIVLFLNMGLCKGLAPNTLWCQVVALSSVLTCGGFDSLTSYPAIRQFLQGTTNTRPPVVHWFPMWDLTKVLQALTLETFEPLRDVSLCFLSLKMAFLVAVTLARRISELAALSARPDMCSMATGWYCVWTLHLSQKSIISQTPGASAP